MPVRRRVQSKVTTEEGKTTPTSAIKRSGAKRVCFFCQKKKEPSYTDTATLRRYLNDRGRISPKGRTGTCSKHQRRVSREIKRARFLALLPYTVGA